MVKSTKSTPPRKPHSDFPLFAHAVGQWAKKVKGKTRYFGPWSDPDAALELWLAHNDDLLAGREPRDRRYGDAKTLRDLCNNFIETKAGLLSASDCRALLARYEREKEKIPENILEILRTGDSTSRAGELSLHSWRDYLRVCKTLVDMFGADRLLTDILPEDFQALRTKYTASWGPVRVGNEINRVRVVFNFAFKNLLIDRPMQYGEGFKRPSRKTLRIDRASKGSKMFEADELRKILDAAEQPLKPMLLLAINAGLGNSDIGNMPLSALDLDGAWLSYPRPKTGISRRCPLWPETVKALREWLKVRPAHKVEAHAALVFTTAKGGSWVKDTTDNPVSKETRKLLDSLEINGGRNFYAIRHSFETIAGGSRDQVAVDFIMGHADETMGGKYRERIDDSRLIAVADHVRQWLFGKPGRKKKEK